MRFLRLATATVHVRSSLRRCPLKTLARAPRRRTIDAWRAVCGVLHSPSLAAAPYWAHARSSNRQPPLLRTPPGPRVSQTRRRSCRKTPRRQTDKLFPMPGRSTAPPTPRQIHARSAARGSPSSSGAKVCPTATGTNKTRTSRPNSVCPRPPAATTVGRSPRSTAASPSFASRSSRSPMPRATRSIWPRSAGPKRRIDSRRSRSLHRRRATEPAPKHA